MTECLWICKNSAACGTTTYIPITVLAAIFPFFAAAAFAVCQPLPRIVQSHASSCVPFFKSWWTCFPLTIGRKHTQWVNEGEVKMTVVLIKWIICIVKMAYGQLLVRVLHVFIYHFNRLPPTVYSAHSLAHSFSRHLLLGTSSNYIDEHLLYGWHSAAIHLAIAHEDTRCERAEKEYKNRTLASVNLCSNQFVKETCSNWICILHFWCIQSQLMWVCGCRARLKHRESHS